MSMKINVSYTDDTEMQAVMTLLKPILDRFKVKKSANTVPYKHLYFIPKNDEKPHK